MWLLPPDAKPESQDTAQDPGREFKGRQHPGELIISMRAAVPPIPAEGE